MKKEDLVVEAHSLGLRNVDMSWTRREMLDAIAAKKSQIPDVVTPEEYGDDSPGEDSPGDDDETSPGEGDDEEAGVIDADSLDELASSSPGDCIEEGESEPMQGYVIRSAGGSRIPGVVRLPGRGEVKITQF